ncbi:MAG: hypothetical protein NTZ77_07015 [Caldiserica bacterium]|nr:hypothetical protein [Caldisericota bacterium]
MTRNSHMILALLLISAIGLTVGCAPKAAVKGSQINMMTYALRNLPMDTPPPDYDAVPLVWDIGQNTVTLSPTPVVHVDGKYADYPLHWSSGSPLLAVQTWDSKNDKPLLTATSSNTQILVPPDGARRFSSDGAGAGMSRWYAPAANAFVTVPYELVPPASQKRTIVLTQYPLASGSETRRVIVPVPSGLAQIVVLYGSGSVDNGFVLIDIPGKSADNVARFDLWLLRMGHGEAVWVKCVNTLDFDGNLFTDQDASFARIGSLLYFTHAHGKIYCIDTAAASPSVAAPEKINTVLEQLYKKGPTNTEGPLQASLASDSGVLIIRYPDYSWDREYYAVSSSGDTLGFFYADGTSVTCFDGQGKRGTHVAVDNARGVLSFPSFDLFESYTTLTGTSTGAADEQVFFAAARSFAEQALAAGNHHLTAEPVITVSSKQLQSGKMAVMMYIHTMDAMNSGDPATQPIIVGELQYLHDHGAELSAAARKAVEDDISEWRNTIESAMNTPTETNYLIKIVADVDQSGTVDAGTLQVYVDDGAVGIHLTPAAEFLKGMRSAWTTLAQAYANAASIAAAAKAP